MIVVTATRTKKMTCQHDLQWIRWCEADIPRRICSTIDQRYPFLAAGKSVVFHTKLGAFLRGKFLSKSCMRQKKLTTACTTYARSLPIAISNALFSMSAEQISLIQLRMSGPAPN